jgi:hypothetical protein
LDHGRAPEKNLLLINRSGEKRPGYIPREHFLETIEMQPAVTIPLMSKPSTGPADYGAPAAAHRGPIAQGIEALAGEISGKPVRERPWWALWQR